MVTSALDVAEYIINFQHQERGLNVSNLKLQKLVFYCQAFHLAMKDETLFTDEIEAWTYGPVIRKVYDEYKCYGNSIISPCESNADGKEASPNIKASSLGVISAVLEAYGHLSAIALMETTHREKPWVDAFSQGNGTVISNQSMQEYYKKLVTQ